MSSFEWPPVVGSGGGGGGGTVTSVGLVGIGGFLTVTGSPITTAGTFVLGLSSQSANTIFAGPASGPAAAPTFRGMVNADFPTNPIFTGNVTAPVLINSLIDDSNALVAAADHTKKVEWNLNGIPTGHIVTLGFSTGGGDITITMPDLTSTVAALQAIQTFTQVNTFSNTTVLSLVTSGLFDDSNALVAASDHTKKVEWNNNGIATGHIVTLDFSTASAADISIVMPSFNSTVAVLNVNGQNFTATQTFSNTVTMSGLTASRALALDASSNIVASVTTATELGYVSGVTSSIQTQLNAKGSGTVTSVALSAPGVFTVSGSPVTTSGTLTLALATQTANTVWAGPGSGGALAPTFRLLVSADIPNNAANTTGTASNVTGTVAVANGGTSLTTLTLNNVILGNGTSAPTFVAPGTSGNVLTSNGTTWVSQASGAGSGTVTSVALSLPAIFTVTGSPVTTSGTLTGTLATQTANFVWAGPSSGAAATPTFRALVNADLPAVTVTNKAANYTVVAADNGTYFTLDTSGGAFNLTLPTPTSGFRIKFVDSTGSFGTNNLTLVRSGTEKISGLAASKVFQTNWGGWEVFSNGTDWFVI